MASVRIFAKDLWTTGDDAADGSAREPLSRLGAEGSAGHVHGTLTIEIGGKSVPHLGYWGPDDVCLDTWLVELCQAVNTLRVAGADYTFDEGEQGQPAFKFERRGEDVALSIVASALSGAAGDPAWQKVRFAYQDFHDEVRALLDHVRAQLRREAPGAWERWWPVDALLAP